MFYTPLLRDVILRKQRMRVQQNVSEKNYNLLRNCSLKNIFDKYNRQIKLGNIFYYDKLHVITIHNIHHTTYPLIHLYYKLIRRRTFRSFKKKYIPIHLITKLLKYSKHKFNIVHLLFIQNSLTQYLGQGMNKLPTLHSSC